MVFEVCDFSIQVLVFLSPPPRFEALSTFDNPAFQIEIMGQYYKPCIITIRDGIAVVLAWLYSHRFGNGLKQMEHSYLGNNFVEAFEWLISPQGPHHKSQVVWAGDYGGIENGYNTNLYGLCNDANHADVSSASYEYYPFIVNHSKQCFIDKGNVNGEIHPLPLLTTETVGGGGGDYRGRNEHFLGIWARDVISVEKEAPADFEEVFFEFSEDR